MDRKSIQILMLSLVTLAIGCTKATDEPPVPTNTGDRKAFVVCEGSLGNGNSALGLYLPEKDSAFQDIYKAVNSQSLGDVFQSMTLIGNEYFLCINNSDKILTINRDTWKFQSITNVTKPRYILKITDEKAYVSTLFSNKLTLLQPQTHLNSGVLTLPYKNPEGMVLLGSTAYIATWDTSCHEITTINTNTDAIGDPIPIAGAAPQDILLDKNQTLWILAGNVNAGKSATLTHYDPVTKTTLQTFAFAAGADPIRPVFNEAKDTLYFIEVNYNGGSANNGIYRMSIADPTLPSHPFIAARGFQYFWALGIQPGTGYIYVGDPKGFTQRGSAGIYDQQGSLLKTFPTAVGPGHFLFDR